VGSSDGLRRYLDLLVQTLDDDVSGRDLARRAFLSRFHFDRVVRAAVGEPPATLRRRLLLERAAYGLAGTQATATELAFAAGYDSLGAFSRAFARAFGVPPTEYRARGDLGFRLPAPNGIHFHPPAALFLAASKIERSHTMDLTEMLVEHDLALTRALVDKAGTVDNAALDRPLDLGDGDVPEISERTLRGLLDQLVHQKENWTASITGRPEPDERDRSIAGLRQRLARIAPEWRSVVREIREKGSWDDSFIDTLCEPPETFSFRGALAHVLTISAYRRALAIGALRAAGVPDVGYGDPLEWERSRSAGTP
jgi:AraC family transcriptional regulator